MTSERWAALESNPSVFTNFMHSVGVRPVAAVHDVFGTDPDLLMMVPQPVYALLLCYPSGVAKKLGLVGRDIEAPANPVDLSSLWYMKQPPALGNACGTIALLHSVLNSGLPIEEGSALDTLVKETAGMTPEQKAEYLDKSTTIASAHNAGVVAGETAVAAADDVRCHFVAFIPSSGYVVELDGAYQNGPVARAALTDDGGSFLQQAVEVVKKEYFEKLSECSEFSLMALAAME